MVDAPTKQVIKLLARYWCDSPLACDTADGIRRWWLSSADDVSLQHVSGALDYLRNAGFIEELRAADGRAMFRRLKTNDDEGLHGLVRKA